MNKQCLPKQEIIDNNGNIMVVQPSGDEFKKLCKFRHKWDDGWVCSKCGVRKADWVESGIKTTTREENTQ